MTNTKRKRYKTIFILLAILILAPFLSPGWSAINCSHQDIDLDTGRARFTRMLYWIPIHSEIKHTPISKALDITELETKQGDWQRVNTFSLWHPNSPHYTFHGAFAQVRTLNMLWGTYNYTSASRRITANNLLKMWKQSGEDSGADEYIYDLGNISFYYEDQFDIIEHNKLK